MSTWHRGERVESRRTGEIGTVSHGEHDGLVWVVWPPTSGNNRYSASGVPPIDLKRLAPDMRQITLE